MFRSNSVSMFDNPVVFMTMMGIAAFVIFMKGC